jgi:hypothetical protein
MRHAIILLLLTGYAATTYAIPVNRFPGVDKLIEIADHIAVVTIVKHISGDGQGYDEYHVWVRRTLKGTVPENQTTAMSLLYSPLTAPTGTLDAYFVKHRTYILFLQDAGLPFYRAPYRNLQMVGSHWEATLPHPDWSPEDETSLRDIIEMLIELNLKRKENTISGERDIFEETFTDSAEPETGAYP